MIDQPGEPVTHVPKRPAPYDRALDDGTTVDRKATAWITTHVLVTWYHPDTPYAVVAGIQIHMHSAWLPSDRVERFKRSESAWQDVYDEPGHE